MTSAPSSPYTTVARGHAQRLGIAGWVLRFAALSLAVALAAVWLEILRPVSLGGPAGYTIVSGSSMVPTLASGDLVVTMAQSSYEIGDVIVYEIPPGESGAGVRIIHRIVGGSAESGFEVQGDNRDSVDSWRPTTTDIVGEVRVSAPWMGDALLFLRTGLGIATLAGLLTLFVVLAIVRGPAQDRSGAAA